MLEPQSTALFLLLMAAFGALVVWAVLAKQPVFRLLAACLAFIPAMLFGVAAVNKYYGYYETWAAVLADFTNRGVQNIPHVPSAGRNSARQFDHLLGRSINAQQAALGGAEIGLKVTGAKSRIARNLIIYLPPQYFQKQYATYRFPAIELIHGQPGEPQDWLAALDVQTTLQDLVAAHRAQPVVLVMPDVNGGRAISLQCLNQVGGAADDDFVALDVPDFARADVLSAVAFVALLRTQNPATPLRITADGAHNAVAWRSMIPPMLEWLSPRLAEAAGAAGCRGCARPTATNSAALVPSSG